MPALVNSGERAFLAILCLAAACTVPAQQIAPPTDVRAETVADGPIRISWARSEHDGGEHSLVGEYQVLRSTAKDGPFVPFAGKNKDGKRPIFIDESTTAGTDYYYRVWAIPARELSSTTERGGIAAASSAVGPVRAVSPVAPITPGAPADLKAAAPNNDSGEHIQLSWAKASGKIAGYLALRATSKDGPYLPFAGNSFGSEAEGGKIKVPSADGYYFALFALPESGGAARTTIGPITTRAALFHTGRFPLFGLLVLSGGTLFAFVRIARTQGDKMFIRKIPGIDALEDAIGRATETGRPVLYVPGVEETISMQTIATVLVLGHVAERVAKYGAKLRVAVNFPMTLPLAQESVKQGFLKAGRPDAYNANDVQWISQEQFAFTAGTNGIILREKPATNIYLGRFYAESLILSETGFVNKAIQIAGTAEIPQLPFFVAACDYTLIGEELYAMSAYLSRQPALLGTLKGGDVVKVVTIGILLLGAALGLAGLPQLADVFAPPS